MTAYDTPIAKLGHVAAETPDLDESLSFLVGVLGLKLTERTDGVAYLRGMRDWEHHTLRLEETGRATVDHVAWRTRSPEALDELADGFESAGVGFERVAADAVTGHGEALRVERFGHPYEFYYDAEKPPAPEGERSRLGNRVYSEATASGAAPRRIDHVHLQGPNAADHVAWLRDGLGFGVNERYRSGDQLWGWWLSVTPLPHDVAVHRNAADEPPEFHHVAYHVDGIDDLWRTADALREVGIAADGGPGRHAITGADFLYVRDPASGLGVELFAGPGYLNFEPDWEPVEWTDGEIGGEDDHQWIGQGPGWGGRAYE